GERRGAELAQVLRLAAEQSLERLQLGKALRLRKHPQAVAVDVDLMPELARHPVLDALPLPHRDAGRDDRPGRGLVRVRPVDRPEALEPLLQAADDGVALADGRPPAPVDVEAEYPRDLRADVVRGHAAVDLSVDAAVRILREADAGRLPAAVGEESQVQVAALRRAVGRRLVPRADEIRPGLQREGSQRLDLERGSGGDLAH